MSEEQSDQDRFQEFAVTANEDDVDELMAAIKDVPAAGPLKCRFCPFVMQPKEGETMLELLLRFGGHSLEHQEPRDLLDARLAVEGKGEIDWDTAIPRAQKRVGYKES